MKSLCLVFNLNILHSVNVTIIYFQRHTYGEGGVRGIKTPSLEQKTQTHISVAWLSKNYNI